MGRASDVARPAKTPADQALLPTAHEPANSPERILTEFSGTEPDLCPSALLPLPAF